MTDLDESWIKQAQSVALKRGVSMEILLREALLSSIPEKRAVESAMEEEGTNGLEKFAGILADESAQECEQWENFLNVELNEIHAEDWK